MSYDHLLRADNRYERELTAEEAFRIASFGLAPPASRTVVTTSTPYFFDPARWGVHLPRDVDDVVEQTLSNELLAWIRDNPQTFAPANRYYVKNHVNAPGTVRRWFREMRAADFHRALPGNGVVGWVTGWQKWTLFDTMKVVDRETAPHYADGATWFVHNGMIVGVVDGIDWTGTPAVLMGVEPTYREDYLGIDRSVYPMFSSKVESARARGITIEDIRAFVNSDDARRPERRRRGAGW